MSFPVARGLSSSLLLVCLLASGAAAQDAAADYKALYAEAEYERALVMLSPLDTLEAYQYRALCLLALGRPVEATNAVKKLIMASPEFVASAEEAPPRFVELVAVTRKALLPVIARQAFAEGRERFGNKQNDDAIKQFTLVLTLASDPGFGDAATAQDLKTLAQGFIDLAKATAAPPPKPAPAVETPIEKPIETAVETPPPPVPPRVTQAVSVVQTVPPVPSNLLGRLGARLMIRVSIDSTGKVTSATVTQSAHPLYDRLVVQATREWRYTPATVNGTPIPSEQAVTFQTER
jgi:TonB family protein